MKGLLKKYSDGWFIESIIDDNGEQLSPTIRIKVHPEQLTNDNPYHAKFGVDDTVHFEVRKISTNSELQVINENVAYILNTQKVETQETTQEPQQETTQEPQQEPVEAPTDEKQEEVIEESNSKMSYRVVISKNPLELMVMVNKLLQQDWIPQGGVCVNNELFHQAMVKIN